ncbi:uncharacterized protein LOC127250850 [Andrographis paniculata]|uniref:uncharacterized protein LOC127250850 n=1 Tax=Andrographis paniculata TaxID=175694 RepID=UPI0021E79723|nr:uncharacterized protein LOC127250850 [Andrographis paniculata]
MSRSDHTRILSFGPEIEKITRRLRKETRERRQKDLASESSSDFSSDEIDLEEEIDQTTLRELAASNLTQQHVFITYPTVDGEEPHKHLQEFNVVCTSMKPLGVKKDQIKIRVFPFSLKDAAKDWLFNLPAGSVTTWTDMKIKFFENCPHHQIPVQLLIQYFYEGLISIDMRIIDAESGRALMNKTSRKAWDLLHDIAMNSQHFGPKRRKTQFQACGICTSQEHPTDTCPILSQEIDVNATGFVPKAYDLHSNTYNSGWRDHSNLKYGNQQANFGDHSRGFLASNYPPQPLQAEIRNNIRSLEEQVSQIVNEMCEIMSREKDSEVSKTEAPNDKNEDDIENEVEQAANETSDKVTSETPTHLKTNVAPLPCRLVKPKKDDKNKKMMKMFRKMKLNIPLLDVIKQVPKYAKFLKDLYANKKRLREDECIIAGESGILEPNDKSILDIKSKPPSNQLESIHLNDNINLAEKFL